MHARANSLHPALLRLEADVIEASALDAVLKAHPTCGFTCTIFEGDMRAAKLLAARGFTLVGARLEAAGRANLPPPSLSLTTAHWLKSQT